MGNSCQFILNVSTPATMPAAIEGGEMDGVTGEVMLNQVVVGDHEMPHYRIGGVN